MSENYLEKEINEKTFRVIEYLFKYLNTTKLVFTNPQIVFLTIKKSRNFDDVLLPGVFLISNLIFSNLLNLLLGKELPNSPEIDLPQLQKYISQFSFIFIKYALGYFAFAYLFKKNISKYSGKYFELKTAFEIVCYASVAYIPIVIISKISFFIDNFSLAEFMTENAGSFFLSNQKIEIPDNTSSTFLIFVFSSLLVFIFVFFWLYILNIALKVFDVEKRIKILGLSSVFYLGIKFIGVLVLTFFTYLPSINDIYWLIETNTSVDVKTDPPNYFLAKTTLDSFARDKVVPSKTRFQCKLLSIACSLELLKPLEYEKLAKKIYALIRINENGTAYNTLNGEIEKLNNGEYDDMYSSYRGLKMELSEAVSIRDSFSPHESYLSISPLRHHDNNFNVQWMLQPSFLGLFPDF